MASLLVRNADVLVTMDDTRREIPGGGLFARDGVVEAVGTAADLPETADTTIDATGTIAMPGLVNTHHHIFQNLTRAVPGAQDESLFGWLKRLYPIWRHIGPEDVFHAVRLGLAELALSGCTTTADHLYLYPNGARIDDAVAAARAVRVRLHAARGALTVGESAGGLPPDDLVEDEGFVIADTIRAIDAFHDPAPGAMVRIAVAPCSPFTVTRDLMRESASLARDKGVMLHTHLAENEEDVAYSLERFGQRPGAFAEDLGWTGADVWHAHCVKLDAAEIGLFARTRTGVAHCPNSNMRLGSGIAPVRAMRDRGVTVGLGVDGSASSDAADLLAEARQAMLLQRVANGAGAMAAREALEIATLGGARVLGRDDLGSLAPGQRADIALYDAGGIAMSGAWDPVAALVLTGPHRARHTIVEGKPVVLDGRLATVDPAELLAAHAARSARLRDL